MTNTGKEHVDACRFCWMCRHICPVGNATGQERNTARARALGLSYVNRGAGELKDIIDNIYECACCGACTGDCATGWDPVLFVREARLDAALAGILPAKISRLVDRCLDTGNAYGGAEPADFLMEAVKRHEKAADQVLFLGVDARYRVPEAAVNAILALEKAGAEFTVLADEPASGQQLLYLIGAADETKTQMTTCAEALRNFKQVIAFDPQDASVFRREYRQWGVEHLPDVITFPAYLWKLAADGALDFPGDETPDGGSRAEKQRIMTYQDPFQLSRDLGETEEARQLIGRYGPCREMLMHGKDTIWAGNLLMKEWLPETMLQVAAKRISQAVSVGADTIVTASVSEYAALKEAAGQELKILSLEELVLGK